MHEPIGKLKLLAYVFVSLFVNFINFYSVCYFNFFVSQKDTVVVRETGSEVLTKQSKEWKDVCYNLNGDEDEDNEDDSDEDDDSGDDGGRDKSGSGGDGGGGHIGAVKTRRMRDKGKM